jgi:hypothetical protein
MGEVYFRTVAAAMTLALCAAIPAAAQMRSHPIAGPAQPAAVPDSLSADAQPEPERAPAAAAGACPGSGDCCVAHGLPGCNDFECCDFVCFLDDACCVIGWSETCVTLAEEVCGSLCQGGGGCPGTEDCCAIHGSPACEDAGCCSAVCGIDADCCDITWSSVCVSLAEVQCATLCAPPDPCPGPEDCCAAHDSPGCADEACCDLVCGEDAYCCGTEWDSICSEIANLLCVPHCEGPCPSDGDCCTAHGGGGCDDSACCQAVCGQMASCCQEEWTSTCAMAARTLCAERCGGDCPGDGDCCSVHASPGCNVRDCCAAVCAEEAFCCFGSWDADCVSLAQSRCENTCGIARTCGGIGSCCTAQGSGGCIDQACCERVCRQTPSCCTSLWTTACAGLAMSVCGGACHCPQFGDFNMSKGVDLGDVAAFQLCFSGSGNAASLLCRCGDFSGDGDVDLLDHRAFVQQLTGP